VSNAPIRPALYAPSRLAASGITQKITSRQVGSNEWALYPKIINLDSVFTPLHQRWCFEIHPEISFCAWNNGTPIQFGKDSDQGRQAREALIDAAWPGVRQEGLGQLERQGMTHEYVALDDLNDAFAALWTSRRIAAGQARRIPDAPEVDARGLRMEMWY
jgi:predicted RNase H-like nuclease